jgi:periplasmic protein TonB
MFGELVESSISGQKTNQGWAVVLSVVLQMAALSVFVLIPLIYTEALPQRILDIFVLAPPPPRSAPAPAAAMPHIAKPVPHWIQSGKLIAPARIPPDVQILNEQNLNGDTAPDVGADCSGCVGGGVPGGNPDGLPSGIIGSIGTGPAPPAPVKPAPQLIRVGGNVQAAKIIHQVQPLYPAVARTAHISGTVVLHAIIGKDGSVEQLQYVSGPPLLMRSAMDTVRQWRYQPTLLDGDPVEVDTTITVVFTLGG